jgi:hypothetical protein
MNKPTRHTCVITAALLAALAVASCTKPQLERAGDVVVDCTLSHLRGQILTELVALITAVLEKNLEAIADLAVADLSNIKACALAEYKARQPRNVASRRETPDPLVLALDRVRAARGGASFKTDAGKM